MTDQELQEALAEYIRKRKDQQHIAGTIQFVAGAFENAGATGCANYLYEWAGDIVFGDWDGDIDDA